jgi:hypothetical protein
MIISKFVLKLPPLPSKTNNNNTQFPLIRQLIRRLHPPPPTHLLPSKPWDKPYPYVVPMYVLNLSNPILLLSYIGTVRGVFVISCALSPTMGSMAVSRVCHEFENPFSPAAVSLFLLTTITPVRQLNATACPMPLPSTKGCGQIYVPDDVRMVWIGSVTGL